MSSEEITKAGPLVSWSLHGMPVYEEPKVKVIFDQEWLPKMEVYLENIVSNEIYLTKVTDRESELGNLVADLIFEAAPLADFAVINPGSFRTTWLPGIIQYQHFYGMFPFDNVLQTFEIDGSELLAMFEILQAGTKGLYSAYPFQHTVKVTTNADSSVTR